ncbi:unnamed protein product [Citrullus colocynthis]|uniref:Uncharacterized protein n=1 Tax=Citrullus colocynthis TaxID=252529 RepID=A0ABP0ZDB1_9ROSI
MVRASILETSCYIRASKHRQNPTHQFIQLSLQILTISLQQVGSRSTSMASLKAEKPAQQGGQSKKEAKPSDTAVKASASKSNSASKKPAQRSQDPPKKRKGGKSAVKH